MNIKTRLYNIQFGRLKGERRFNYTTPMTYSKAWTIVQKMKNKGHSRSINIVRVY